MKSSSFADGSETMSPWREQIDLLAETVFPESSTGGLSSWLGSAAVLSRVKTALSRATSAGEPENHGDTNTS